MSGATTFRAVFRQELRGRGPLLGAAFALGLLPFLLPLLPSARGAAAADLRLVAAPLFAVVGITLLGLVLGADLVARELAERRLGFYLARPIPVGVLLAGKLAAAYALLLVGSLAMIVPVALVDRLGLPRELPPAFLLFLPPGMLLLLLAASALAVLMRARSRRLAFDVAALALGGVLAGTAVAGLRREHAIGSLALGLSLFGLAAVAALVAGLWAALEHGRVDLATAGRALSRRLWSLLLPACAAFALFAAWTLSPTPAAVREVLVAQPSPGGDWLAYSGKLAGRFDFVTLFLWHPASGRSFRIPVAAPDVFPAFTFAPDDSVAVWLERDHDQWVAWRLDLAAAAAGAATPRRTSVSFAVHPSLLTVSAGGRLLAARAASRWTLDDLATGKLLASVADEAYLADARWVDGERLRLFTLEDFDLPVAKARAWDLAAAGAAPPAFRATGFAAALAGHATVVASPDGRRVLLRDEHGWRLADVESGASITEVAALELQPVSEGVARPRFLADGRIVTRRHDADGTVLRLLDRDGALQREMALPGVHRVSACGLLAADTLLVSARPTGASERRLLEVDLRTGRFVERGRGLVAPLLYGFNRDPVQGRAARWFVSDRGRLLYLRGDRLVDPAMAND